MIIYMCIILAHYVVRSAVSDHKTVQFEARFRSDCMLRMYFTPSNAKPFTAKCMNCVMLL